MTPFNSRHFKVVAFILLMTFSDFIEMNAQKSEGFTPIQTIFQICNLSDRTQSDNSDCPEFGSTIPISTDANCQGIEFLSFHLVNVFDDIPDPKTTSLLPTEYPSFYFRWNQDSQTEITIGPFRQLRYVESITHLGNTVDFYAVDFEFSLNCTKICNSSTANLSVPIEVLYFPIGGTELIDYPIEAYSGEDEIFSCEIFTSTEDCCEPGGCPDLEYELDLCIDCQNCYMTENFTEDTNMEFFIDGNVYPNPFSEEINFSLQATHSQNIQIKFTNVSNQESIIINESMLNGRSQKRIDTSMLKPGVYIVTVNNGNQSFSKKIIKLGVNESRQ